MPYRSVVVAEAELQDVLNQTVLLGPFSRTGLPVGGKTLIFNTPSVTVTFSGALNDVLSLATVAAELEAAVTGLDVDIRSDKSVVPGPTAVNRAFFALWRDDGSGTAGTVIDSAGTANADFGLSTVVDTTYAGPLTSGQIAGITRGSADGTLALVISTGADIGSGGATSNVAVTNFPAVQPVSDNGDSFTTDTPQLPAALVGGRLDGNTGAWLGSTAPTVGQKPMANSVPVALASDYQTQGVTAPAAVSAVMSNVIPLVRYNATPPTATDGQVGALQTDVNLNLKIREQYTDVGSFLPSFSTALEKSRVISAVPADLLEYALEIDAAATTGTYWLWIINATGVPADGTAIGSIAALQLPRAIAHTNGTKTTVALTSFRFGIRGSTGIVLALSSNASQFTFTLVGTAWVAFSAMYRTF